MDDVLRAGDFVVTDNGTVGQVVCEVEAMLIVFADDSSLVLPTEMLTRWRPTMEWS